MPIQTPLLAVVPALLIAAVVLAALWRPWVKGDRPRPMWAGAAALAAAVIVADPLVNRNWPGLWSPEEQRRVWITAVLGLIAAIVDVVQNGRVRRTAWAWAAGAVIMGPVLGAAILHLDLGSILRWVLYAGAVVLLWSEVGAASERIPGPQVPLILSLAAAGAALAIIQSYSLSMGLTAAALGAGMGAFAVLAFWRPQMGRVTAAMPVYAGVLASLLAASSQTFLEGKILIVASAATPCLMGRGPFAKLNPWLAAIVCGVITAGLAAWALKYTPGGFQFGEGAAGSW